MESVFYGFETLNLIAMNTKRIEEIQKETAYLDSISVQQALLKVWNECEQERAVKNNAVLPLVSKRFEIEFKYVDRTDATLHKEIIDAEDSGQAISKLFQKYGYNIEWWTVKNVC